MFLQGGEKKRKHERENGKLCCEAGEGKYGVKGSRCASHESHDSLFPLLNERKCTVLISYQMIPIGTDR